MKWEGGDIMLQIKTGAWLVLCARGTHTREGITLYKYGRYSFRLRRTLETNPGYP